VRDFWRGTPGTLADFATRLTGSSGLFSHGRRPTASINLVCGHDGFTLNDLVSYDAKHNEANRDGNDDDRSWNCGVEGPTDDPRSSDCGRAGAATSSPPCCRPRARRRCSVATSSHARSAATTTPTAQDNAISWVDWARATGT
jgi:glycogen operon protein